MYPVLNPPLLYVEIYVMRKKTLTRMLTKPYFSISDIIIWCILLYLLAHGLYVWAILFSIVCAPIVIVLEAYNNTPEE